MLCIRTEKQNVTQGIKIKSFSNVCSAGVAVELLTHVFWCRYISALKQFNPSRNWIAQ